MRVQEKSCWRSWKHGFPGSQSENRDAGRFRAEVKKKFSESFEEINNNFKQIFVELFGGGKAELVLVNPDDILESGIEINVAPPGKVIKNLSLLSGGEQSFVAIAIYFAILKLRPAPFCILDEIEAALDDVNVSKYAQYLRNFTKTTQFILVTHRRGTMNSADRLYGITMQEKGISALVSVDLLENSLEKEDSSSDDKETEVTVKSSGFKVVNLKAGEILSLGESAEIILRTGSATVVGGTGGGLSDVTAGKDVPDGGKVELNHLLITPRDDGRGIKVSENSAVMVKE